jgi:hypothetical protein
MVSRRVSCKLVGLSVGLCSGERVGILGAGWETPWVLVMKEEGW